MSLRKVLGLEKVTCQWEVAPVFIGPLKLMLELPEIEGRLKVETEEIGLERGSCWTYLLRFTQWVGDQKLPSSSKKLLRLRFSQLNTEVWEIAVLPDPWLTMLIDREKRFVPKLRVASEASAKVVLLNSYGKVTIGASIWSDTKVGLYFPQGVCPLPAWRL